MEIDVSDPNYEQQSYFFWMIKEEMNLKKAKCDNGWMVI